METGEKNVKDCCENFNHLAEDGDFFSVVVDPYTDFKVQEVTSEPSSPQQSFDLPSVISSIKSVSEDTLHNLPSRSHSSLSINSHSSLAEETNVDLHTSLSPSVARHKYFNLDTNSWSSEISICSGSGTGLVKDKGGTNAIGGNNSCRLIIPEVHRFGSNPPCAGSPHDLASCPVPGVNVACKEQQIEKLRCGEIDERYDALKALSQASSALALTETLIGPLKIPRVSQEVLDKVVSEMEKKVSISSHNNTSVVSSNQKQPVPVNVNVSIAPPVNNQHKTSGGSVTASDIQKETYHESKRVSDSIPSIIVEPDIHKNLVNNINIVNGEVKSSKVDLLLQDDGRQKISYPNELTRSNSKVIAVPVGMSDHGPIEVYKEVHAYPASSITTVVEKCSYIGQTQANLKPPSGKSRHKKTSKKSKNRRGEEKYLSQSSLASTSSVCSSAASDSTVVSKNSSETNPGSRTSSKAYINDSRSEGGGSLSKPVLSVAIKQMRQALESVSDNHSDRSSGGIDGVSTFSDTSSNLSTLSDLSGYEDEYIRIKRLVSDAVIPPEDYKKLLSKTNAKSNVLKLAPSMDYEKLIRDLQAQKEDLEIQLHRLSIQVQNAVREKELYQQQLELMNTKITESNQKQYFEVLKQRANLEGQLEMLKQELENSVYERNQLQAKISDAHKEEEKAKKLAAEATETKSQINARLLKYEEANKDLEEKLKCSEEELGKVKPKLEKSRNENILLSDKNISLELSIEKSQETEAHLFSELKNLKSQVSQLQSECQNKAQAQHQAEALTSKTLSELKGSQNSCAWYQEQLHLSQAARSNIQQELLEAKSSIAKLLTEKENIDAKVQSLTHEAQDSQARSVREKASLVAHLEALQADMAEREALVSQMERDHGNNTKLMEDRRQRLEQDRQRIHKLRLDLSDAERYLDKTKDELKHKTVLISKYEKELKDLRTAEAVNQEVIGEKDARIVNLEESLSENTLLLKNEQQNVKEKIIVIDQLKENNSKLEISLTVASNEKKEVDDAILKVREDMTKLSSNFYRMKHDIGAKERQIEKYLKEAEDLKYAKDVLQKKLDSLELKLKDDDEKQKLLSELISLNNNFKELTTEKDNACTELNKLKRTFKTLDIEKKGLTEAVQLREEQIQNMQASLENYREAILKKDEELYVTHEQTTTVEKSYEELRRNWEMLKDENIALRQDAEAYVEYERLQKKELSELKESIQMERKLKQTLEKKMEKLIKAQQENQIRIESETNANEVKITGLTQELLTVKEEKIKSEENLKKLNDNYNHVCRELESIKESTHKPSNQLKGALEELESVKKDATYNEGMVKVLEQKVEDLLRENNNVITKWKNLQTEKYTENTELQKVIKAKGEEILGLKVTIKERDSMVTKIKEEKDEISNQASTLLTEITRLKAQIPVTEVLVKESVNNNGPKETGHKKQQNKNVETLQKEIIAIQNKCKETENTLKEANKQKENLQAAVKNLKKENLLMKAKMKDFESFKTKCKALESSKISVEDFQLLKDKSTELEGKLSSKEEALSLLEGTLMDKESIITTVQQKEDELTLEIRGLLETKNELQNKITLLEEVCHKSQEDLAHYQSLLKVAQSDRDEWMAKYESLRDIIPERDTSTQRAVQLGVTNSRIVNSTQELSVMSSLDQSSNSLSGNSNEMDFMNDMVQTVIPRDSQFDQTMTDLQTQVNLTSKALQDKEKQIHDLQHQISLLHQGSITNPSNSDFTSLVTNMVSEETIPLSVHKQQLQNLKESLHQLQLAKDLAAQKEMSPTREALGEEVKKLRKNMENLESLVSEKDNEIEKLNKKLSEFQEKHRRYESNVRLLTRKLKEHMKGRKSAEKEMQLQAEEHRRVINEEQHRYSVLRCRCIELEGRSESLEGQVGNLEVEIDELRGALTCARKEAQDHHENTLILQKEVGKLQELSKTVDNLKSEKSKIEEKLKEEQCRITDLEINLQKEGQLTNENLVQIESLNLSLEQHKTENSKLQNQIIDLESKCVNLKETLQLREVEYSKLQQLISEIQKTNSDLTDKLQEKESIHQKMIAEIHNFKEEKLKVISESQQIQLQLKDSRAKNDALQNQNKVTEGEIKAAKEEINLLKDRQVSIDTSHQKTTNQLEESISRSRKEVVTLTSQLNQVQKERISYQTQATELRMALHSALAQLKSFEAAEEARKEEASEVGVIPSPSPIDITTLTELMERSVRPVRTDTPLKSLSSCLSSLKEEVATLQTQIQSKKMDEEKESDLDMPNQTTATKDTNIPINMPSGTEIV